MHKIDGAGNINGLFVHEDPALNRPPTEITADFLNAVQMELVNVINWAGLSLDKSNNSQLLIALQSKFSSLSPSGDYATKSAVQFDTYKISDASGNGNTLFAVFSPAITDLSLSHGMVLAVRANAKNTITNPVFSPNNGVIAYKPIVKGSGSPLAVGDILGAGHWIELRYDIHLDSWVLLNPATGYKPVTNDAGIIIAFAGVNPPAGYLACPTSPENISRTVYADLFNAIGTAWGIGDGSSTFGIPWFPADYTLLQGGVVGSASVGQVIAHSHTYSKAVDGFNKPNSVGTTPFDAYSTSNTSTTGGPANLAAGHRVRYCVKY